MTQIEKVLRQFSIDFERLYKQKLSQSEDTGALISSIHTSVRSVNGQYSLIISLEDYWKYIEYGRQPGSFPPLDKIISWVERKIPEANRISTQNGRIPTTPQIAYLVGRKIEREGIEAKPYLAETLEELNRYFVGVLRAAAVNDYREAIFD